MSVKAKYTTKSGLVSEKGTGFEVNGVMTVNGPQPRTGTPVQSEPLALTVSGSMGVEVSNNSSFQIKVPRQSAPAFYVAADISHVRVGVGCKPTISVFHVSSSVNAGGMMYDGNVGTGHYLSFRKQADTNGRFSFVHDDRSGNQFKFFGYNGSTYKNFFRFDYTRDEILFDVSGSLGMCVGGESVEDTAKLEVQSTTQGFLPPRMTTTQRNAISTPAAGLMIYNTSTNKLNFYNGSGWEQVTSSE